MSRGEGCAGAGVYGEGLRCVVVASGAVDSEGIKKNNIDILHADAEATKKIK